MINPANIEQYILEYIDGELSNTDALALEQYIQDNPEYASLLAAYQHTVVQDEQIEFPNKASLYKHKNFKLGSKYLVATAALIIAAGVTIYSLNNTKKITKITHPTQHTPNSAPHNGGIPAVATTPASNISSTTSVLKKKISNSNNHINRINKIPAIATPAIRTMDKQIIQPISGIADKAMIPYTVEIKLDYAQPLNYEANTSANSLEINYPFKNTQVFTESVEQINNLKEKITDGLQNLHPSNIINEE